MTAACCGLEADSCTLSRTTRCHERALTSRAPAVSISLRFRNSLQAPSSIPETGNNRITPSKFSMVQLNRAMYLTLNALFSFSLAAICRHLAGRAFYPMMHSSHQPDDRECDPAEYKHEAIRDSRQHAALAYLLLAMRSTSVYHSGFPTAHNRHP